MRLDDRVKNTRMTTAQMQQQPAGGPHFPAGPGGLPETVEGCRQDEGPGHQPDTQKQLKPGEGERVDVGGNSPAQKPHDLFVDDLKLEKAGIGRLRAHHQATRRMAVSMSHPGREKQPHQTALPHVPGIEEADEAREGRAR